MGRRIVRTRRHGKHLFLGLDNRAWLTVHFGMTGALVPFYGSEDEPDFDRLRIDFFDGSRLALVSRRLFTKVTITENPDGFIEAQNLGPDALDPALDETAFLELMRSRRGGVKSALMDQHLLAGIGNEYSDEILFQARLDPTRQVQQLERSELRSLFKAVRRVLNEAIACGAGSDGGTQRLPVSFLLRNRKAGAPCPRCGAPIMMRKVSGRTVHYCPRCQAPKQ